ncbi:DEAD/DEAH box helicase family protein [bacterium]|nr:DEAD/DEAH box helicase family protein [bacterium]
MEIRINKNLSEEDTKRLEITPAITNSGWDPRNQIRMEYSFTNGRIMVKDKEIRKGKKKKADYLLFYKPNFPIAIVEAKKLYRGVSDGLQQGMAYAECLNVPFVYSSNGKGFYEHDFLTGKERELKIDEFPTPEELWRRYRIAKGLDVLQGKEILSDYYIDNSGKEPRYYQRNAINRTVEAVIQGQKRILLVMATGTGKTYTAFQIIWRLWKSKQKKRILFLADRNILIDQTKVQDFAPFGNAMTKIEDRTVNKSYEIYLSLYQAVTGTEEDKNIYKQFSKNFFDLIIVDECHRGSAKENSSWHEILEYFSSATQIGMTATPKEDKDVSTSLYFGKPIYTYSLKEGIADGFLAPYKVMRVVLDKDLGWRPELGKLDKYGNEIPDREYTDKDWDKTIILNARTETVAKTVMKFLRENDPYAKTIIFCENIDHATRMRDAIARHAADFMKENSKYVMKITGDDMEGKYELDNFIALDVKYPVIAVTSRLMTTGVDAKLCKLVVLDRTINSMTEFKQIIGRGTRINEEYHKYYFTIMDFRKATRLFADPEFDGTPTEIKIVAGADVDEPSDAPDEWDIDVESEPDDISEMDWDDADIVDERPNNKYIIDDVPVSIVDKQVQWLDESGKLICENIQNYYKNFILKRYATESDFRSAWLSSRKKTSLIEELVEDGLIIKEFKSLYPDDIDIFDMLLKNTYDIEPITRKERAVFCNEFIEQLPDIKKEFYTDMLTRYIEIGISALEDRKILKTANFEKKYGTIVEMFGKIGGNEEYLNTIEKIKNLIYGG